MDLSLIPITDLYEELLNRFDVSIFVGRKVGEKDSAISRRYKGDPHLAMGLCSDLIHEINREIIKYENPITPEDL